MARRTKNAIKIPWNGGLNTSVESGILDDNDLVIADNVIFSTSSSRKKREGLTFFDSDIAQPDFRTSSGTTKTLNWTTNSIQIAVGAQNDIIVTGEKITVTTTTASGNEFTYTASNVAATLTAIAEVWTMDYLSQTGSTHDVSGTANHVIFFSAENATKYFAWINVTDGGNTQTDPALTGATGLQVDVLAADTSTNLADKMATQIDAQADFGAVNASAVMTVTNANTGIATDVVDASTGATLAITALGGQKLVYTGDGSATETDAAVGNITVVKSSAYRGILDYWRLDGSSIKQQLFMAASDQFKFFKFGSTGTRIEVAGTGGPTGTVARVNSVVMNDKAIFSFDAIADKPIKFDPDVSSSYAALGGTPPDFFVMSEYLGRLWANDKTDADRLHYSSTGNVEEWNGAGDSGALDIATGDGDSIGITGIFPYKGILFVAKRDGLFIVRGNAPENFKIETVSRGIGIESHASIVAIDQDDVAFVSRRGFHSAAATNNFGDVESSFISLKIQPTFDNFITGRLKFIQGAYVPTINSIVFATSENESKQNNLYLFNVIFKEWYKWPDISCESLATRRNDDETQLIIGTENSRLIRALDGTFSDFGGGIAYRIKSGTIYPGGNPQTWKGFKRISLLFKPKGRANFTLTIQIDNQNPRSFVFDQGSGSDLLGSTFILGTSLLGTSDAFAPFSKDLDGHGRGLTLEVLQTGTEEQVEIFGYSIEFEEEGIVPEVIS